MADARETIPAGVRSGAEMTYETIEVRREGPVTTVSLNRPEVHNAFNARMIAEITDAFTQLRLRSRTRAVILRGHGRSFSAGADVTWMRASLEFSRQENLEDARRMSAMYAAIDALPAPVIARVQGAALGGGMGLLAVCDIVIAARDCRFGFTETKLGIIPAVISPFVLPKLGESWARALFLTGERFGPELARQIGLVHWIAEPEELDALVAEKVEELLSSGPEAVRAAKELIWGVLSREAGARREYTAQRIAEIRTSPGGQEGLRAFLEKRKPAWREE